MSRTQRDPYISGHAAAVRTARYIFGLDFTPPPIGGSVVMAGVGPVPSPPTTPADFSGWPD